MNKPLQPRTPSDSAKSAEQSKGNNSGGKQSTVKIERNSQKGETAQTSDKHESSQQRHAKVEKPVVDRSPKKS